jgi:phosphoribosylformylglycinamidine (FGAM) synthase-like enzyme
MYLRELLGREDGAPPPVDLALERRTGDFIRDLIVTRQAVVVHDLSDGGLIAAVAEMALASKVGVTLDLPGAVPVHAQLFAEDQARYLVATDQPDALIAAAKAAGLPAAKVGQAEGEALVLGGAFNLPLADLRQAHEGWLPGLME